MTRELEPELLHRLGTIVTRWSFVEQCVSDIFIHLTEGNKGAMIVVTSSVSQSTISDWIRALLDILISADSPEDLQLAEDIREVLNDIDECRRDRNALVHGLWGTRGPEFTAMVQTVRMDRREIIKDEFITASDLDQLINDILEICTRLVGITRRMEA